MGREWPLVGRDEELAVLRSATIGGRGALVAGPAGAGRTRCAQELARGLSAEGWRIVTVAATVAGASMSLGAADDLGASPATATDHRPFDEAASRLLARAEPPLLLVVDDADGLDTTSAGLVHHLALSGTARVVVTIHSGARAPAPVIALWKDRLLERVDLEPLAESAIQELLESVLEGPVARDTGASLRATTTGNLVYLRELLADAAAAGTLVFDHGVWRWSGGIGRGTHLSELVAPVLSQLAAPMQALVEAIALGEPLPAATIGTLVPDAHLAEAESRGLIHLHEAAVRMAHPVYAEVVRAHLGQASRQEWFGRLADALAHEPTELVRVLTWRLAAGEPVDAREALRGAREANLRNDPIATERLARAAGPDLSARLVLAKALNDQGRFQEAEGLLGELRQHREPAEPHADSDLVWQRVRALAYHSGRLDGPLAVYSRAQATEPRSQVATDALRVPLLAFAGAAGEASSLAERLNEIVAEQLDDFTRGIVLASIATVDVFQGSLRPGLAKLGSATFLLADGGGASLLGTMGRALIAVTQALALQGLGRWRASQAVLRRALAPHGPVTPRTYEAALIGALSGRAHLLAGEAALARRALLESASVLGSLGGHGFTSWVLFLLAETMACSGSTRDAERTAKTAQECPDARSGLFADDGRRAHAWVLAATGNRSGAACLAGHAADALIADCQLPLALPAAVDTIRLGGGRGALRRAMGVARHIEGPFAEAAALLARAKEANDVAGLQRAGAAFERIGMPLVAADVWQATADAAQSKQHRLLQTAAARRATAVRVAAANGAAASPPDLLVLSRRESDVARLAAQRLSNKEIAARIGSSVRTVESHLHRAYTKLGVHGRAELTSALATQSNDHQREDGSFRAGVMLSGRQAGS